MLYFEPSRLLLRRPPGTSPADFRLTVIHWNKYVTNRRQPKRVLRVFQIMLPQYEKNLGRWAIHTRATNQFVGWCGLKYLPETGEIDLGYRLLPDAWGKGYATEAARNTLAYGFTKLGLKTITARAHTENMASLHVLQKIGMQYVRDEAENDYSVKTFVASASHTEL